MSEKLPLIRQIQIDAADSSTSVVQLVRSAKIAASMLNITDAIDWIEHELGGYPSPAKGDLPKYRTAHGEGQGWNPYNGWIPIVIADEDMHEILCSTGISQPPASIERMANDTSDTSPYTEYPIGAQNILRRLTGHNTKFRLRLSRATAPNITDAVRSLVLDWSLALARAGILGEGMNFKPADQQMAQSASNSFFIQNAAVVGNVSGRASVQIHQVATINVDRARDTITPVHQLAGMLPANARTNLQPFLDEAMAQVTSHTPDQSRLRQALGSMKTICEGLVGNVLAAGFVAALGPLLGG